MKLNQFFKNILLVLSISFSAIFLNSCSSNEDEIKPLRIGMNTWPGYEPFVFAKEQGFLAENVKISRVASATDVIKSFKSDIIDVACITLDEAIILQNRSEEAIKIITIMDFSTGGDAVISKKEIKSMVELKGKRVGVESSALGAFMISRAVDLTPNLKMNDLKIINLGYEHQEAEFKKGNVDAVVTFEPVKTNLLQGNAHVIFDSTQIPGEILDVMVVKEKTILTKKTALQSLVNGWYKSIEYISNNQDKSLQKMAKYEHISYQEFKTAYNGIKVPSLIENSKFYKDKLDDTIIKINAILLEKKLITKSIIPKNIYTDQFLIKVD